MYRIAFINRDAQRVVRWIEEGRAELDAAIDRAFDEDGAQFLSIKKVKGEDHGNDQASAGR
ncbi:hypothetical protein DEH84_06840 [Aquabacterium olei]|uniref:Uncharacterized protein n=1 Tax=Aquabacterium olei TaxID=1296669 RepID=A0A2U8FQ51_9BURK|nr:hypothetical protein [Aquabacterium olei]AWI53175.1 hypothetical protein DEH84_06840 [Aquabacterium olei]